MNMQKYHSSDNKLTGDPIALMMKINEIKKLKISSVLKIQLK